MALVGGACEGIATSDQWSKMCNCLTWSDCAVYGQFSSSGIRETRGCESTHSPRGHEGLLYAGLADGTWTDHVTASDLLTFTITFLLHMRMKETFGLCEGRAEQHYYLLVRAT